MHPNDRIELIKAAVELTRIVSANKVNSFEGVSALFDMFYEHLQLKLEASK